MLVLAGCDEAPTNRAQGYIEGDFLTIAAQHPGRIAELPVNEGDPVAADAVLFRLDTQVAEAALAAAEARVQQAEEQLQDLTVGARPQEVAAFEAAVQRAQADLDLARARMERQLALFERNVASRATLDEAQAALVNAEARLEEAREQLELAQLPSRIDRIEAAEAALAAATSDAEQQRRLIAEHTGRAPEDGLVQEVLRRRGEVVGAGGAVILFLPEDARRAVFFVAQAQLPGLSQGTMVAIACDGCPDGLEAPVSFIDREVQFTPPVIYGPDERQRLVTRVEARLPADQAGRLHPGQPITVTLPDAGDGEAGEGA
jgi:HlyD family secretion protein